MSGDAWVASEFLTLAAYWRAMAVQEIFMGYVAAPAKAARPNAQLSLV